MLHCPKNSHKTVSKLPYMPENTRNERIKTIVAL